MQYRVRQPCSPPSLGGKGDGGLGPLPRSEGWGLGLILRSEGWGLGPPRSAA